MPLDQDPQGGGTNQDASQSILYCSYCYQNGEFVNKEIDTASKMQKFCQEKLKEQGYSRFTAWLYTRWIPRLQRWKTK